MMNTSAQRAELEVEETEQFPLIQRLPPYLFATIETQKRGLTSNTASLAVTRLIDFGLGRPDLPADDAVIQELLAGVKRDGAHSYAPSNGIPELRAAICEWYEDRYRVELDPDSETIVTIGSKEGISHLALAITQPGDVVFVPDPAYPIHESAFVIAGATVLRVPLAPIENYEVELEHAIKRLAGKGRVIVLNFPSNPTGICVTQDFFERVVYLAKKKWLMDHPRPRLCRHRFRPRKSAFDSWSKRSKRRSSGVFHDVEELQHGWLARGIYVRQS